MSVHYPRIVPCGDTGLSVEFGDTIDDMTNAKVIALDRALALAPPEGMIETVPTYRSLMVHYDPVIGSFETISREVLSRAEADFRASASGRRVTIPVCYEGEFGPDLPEVAQRLAIPVEEVVAHHAARTYRVYMLGFQPGFAYLGGLDPALRLPRRAEVRHGAPTGTISIAAAQCGVHGVEGPSGWYWIGRTPAPTFIDGADPKSILTPGDLVRFTPVTARRWQELRSAALHGEPIVEVEAPCLY